jgi:hypothetical protein
MDAFLVSMIEALIVRADNVIEEIEVRKQLLEVSKMISLSYIAENYFHKTRAWLYQKINGNIKNGKPAKFTPEEINTLNFALHDIGKKIGSITIV